VEAALEALRAHGAGASVATIAATAGVTKPVLYRHFAALADLRRAVSERAARMLTERLVPELTARGPAADRIRAIVDTFLATAEEEPELWRFVVHNPRGGEGADGSTEVVAHSMALIAGLISTALVDALRARGRDTGGAEAWAYGLVGLVYTAGDWWLERRTMSRAALVDHLAGLILGGLAGVLGPAADDPPGPADADRRLRLAAGRPPGSRGRPDGSAVS
jgi:AcrR family transcriptional regulator